MADESYIEKFKSVKGMVYQVLRECDEARNSQEWTAHIVRKEYAEEKYGKSISELSKEQFLNLPNRNSIARSMRTIQNNMDKFVPDEDTQEERDKKEEELENHFSNSVADRDQGVTKL